MVTACSSTAAILDLTHAIVLSAPGLTAVEEQAVTMLVEEVEKRSQIRWERTAAWPERPASVIAVGNFTAFSASPNPAAELLRGRVAGGKEGYHLRAQSGPQPLVLVAG